MQQVKTALALLFLSILIVSCTTKEERARLLHNESLQAKRSGDPLKYEELLVRIAHDYPSTVAAAEANKELKDIQFNREVIARNTVNVLRIITTAQILFLTAHGRYARNLEELTASRRAGFDPRFLDPEKGYRYEMKATKEGYTVAASPALRTLRKHFFTDNTAYIREEAGKAATVDSPITTY